MNIEVISGNPKLIHTYMSQHMAAGGKPKTSEVQGDNIKATLENRSKRAEPALLKMHHSLGNANYENQVNEHTHEKVAKNELQTLLFHNDVPAVRMGRTSVYCTKALHTSLQRYLVVLGAVFLVGLVVSTDE